MIYVLIVATMIDFYKSSRWQEMRGVVSSYSKVAQQLVSICSRDIKISVFQTADTCVFFIASSMCEDQTLV